MAVVPDAAVAAGIAPRISVCIANFNGEDMLVDCIESVLAQEGDAPIEILVHDDASTDGSVALLRMRYPQVRLIASPENVGFCTANNRMVEAARGEFLLLLNNDAALYATAVRALLSDAERMNTPAILALPQYDWETGRVVDRGCLLDPLHTPVPNLDPGRQDVAYAIGACLWIPRITWDSLGGFPPWLGSIAEDMYLCCAARLRNLPVRCVDGSGYRHRQGASFGGNRVDSGRLASRYERRYLSERNRLAVIVCCMPTPAMWLVLSMHLAALMIEGAALSLIKRDSRPWSRIYGRAIRDAWYSRDTYRLERRKLQATRRVGLGAYLKPTVWTPWKLVLLFRHGMPGLSESLR